MTVMAPTSPELRPQEILRGATSLVIDSREAMPGSVFVALRGQQTDGHRFIAQAVERGAKVVVMERPVSLPDGVRGVVVSDSARALSALAGAFYGEPAQTLAMLGVTGTNGKTTTTHMIRAILCAAGTPCAVIGTLGASFSGEQWPLENTTPLANELHALLATLRDRGARAVAMEVSSHALALKRVAGIPFRVGALTNITRDHLDFHETFEAYAAAKRSLFEMAAHAVLNHDDPLGAKWAVETLTPSTTYSLHGDADIVAEAIDLRSDGSSFRVGGLAFTLPLPGRFNIANALAALGVARACDISDEVAAQALRELEQVPGRMELIAAGGVSAVVDYAHTPDALRNALRTLRETTGRRLIVVFGAGGDRDRGKRPQMGKIAGDFADGVVVTSDNPRTEDPAIIAAEITAGLQPGKFAVILDRRAAIFSAIAQAEAGDVVLIAGKGHEPYQTIGTQTLPFDDRAVVRDALRARGTPQ